MYCVPGWGFRYVHFINDELLTVISPISRLVLCLKSVGPIWLKVRKLIRQMRFSLAINYIVQHKMQNMTYYIE